MIEVSDVKNLGPGRNGDPETWMTYRFTIWQYSFAVKLKLFYRSRFWRKVCCVCGRSYLDQI